MTTTASCPVHSGSESEAGAPGTPRPPSQTFDMHAPDSLTVRSAGDVLTYLMTGRTFVMQVAHPAVGAGVWEHSAFRQDPWRRLREIDQSGQQFALSGKEASRAEGARLRYLHRNISGVDSHGRHYHALEPHVYGWVHTVFLDSIVTMYRLYGTPLTRAQEEQLFVEWQQGGRMFGLKERDMPATLDAYWEHYAHMLATECEYNPAVAQLLGRDTPPKPPLLRRMPDALWPSVWKPLSAFSRQLTLFSLPPVFREKISAHHPWTEHDERRMQRFSKVVRKVAPLLPMQLRYTPKGRRAMCPV
jgi:uncharacterized protein (DUF2236 family)